MSALKLTLLLALVSCAFQIGAAASNAVVGYDRQASNANVIAIEDQNNTGLYISTGPRNFAITSTVLAKKSWSSVSVNGNQIFIVFTNNQVLNTNYNSLSRSSRDFIAAVRYNFTSNLEGLELAASAYSSSGYGQTQNAYAPIGGYQKPAGIYQANSVGGYQSSGYQSSAAYSAPVPSSSYVTFNYYNLLNTSLNNTLSGDIYNFDFYSNILDIFSTTVSVRKTASVSTLYRDQEYFAYSCPYMPLALNRIFVFTPCVFFIFNDGTVLIKSSKLLNSQEINLVLQARAVIKALRLYEGDLSNSGTTSTTPAPTSTTTTSPPSSTTTTTSPPSSTTTTTTSPPSSTTTTTTMSPSTTSSGSQGQLIQAAEGLLTKIINKVQAVENKLNAVTNNNTQLLALEGVVNQALSGVQNGTNAILNGISNAAGGAVDSELS